MDYSFNLVPRPHRSTVMVSSGRFAHSARLEEPFRFSCSHHLWGDLAMLRRTILALLLAGGIFAVAPRCAQAQDPGGVVFPDSHTYGYQWGHAFSNRDYERFYHYPY